MMLVAAVDDDAAGREIRPLHELDASFFDRSSRRGLLDQVERGVAEFGGVVRRDRGRHADRDAGRAVGEQVREGARQDDRLLVLLVVGRAEVDRVLVDAFEQQRATSVMRASV